VQRQQAKLKPKENEMTRTKMAITIVAVLAGMLAMTDTVALAGPFHHHPHHPHHPHHSPHWTVIVGGILGSAPRRHYVPGHYVTEYQQVLVEPGHYEMQTQNVLVEAGHFETKTIPAVTKTVAKPDGSTEVLILQPEQTLKVWIPDRYETQTIKVWVPARYETRTFQRYVPGHYE
jgi:hypothetical protein